MTFQVTLACVSITPFGRPVVPGRVREEQQIVEVDRHVGVARAPFGEQRFVVQRAGARAAHGDPVEDGWRERGLGQRRVLEDDERVRVGDDERTLVRGEVVVDRGQDGTDPTGREERLEEGHVVLAEPGDPVTMPDAQSLECARESADPLGQRGVGVHAVGSDERRTVRCAPCAAFDPRSDAEVPRAARLHGGTIAGVESENGDNSFLPSRSPMTISTFAASGTQTTLAPVDYEPGVCNIGPAEIARRRRAGHIGLVAALALFAVLVAIDAPNWTRLLIAIPAVMAASGYIQARLKFCAGFGSRGVFNFGEVGPMERVADDADRARDRARARQIGAASIAIGLAAGVIAAVLPI